MYNVATKTENLPILQIYGTYVVKAILLKRKNRFLQHLIVELLKHFIVSSKKKTINVGQN